MTAAKLVITMKPKLLAQIDRWVAAGRYPNRSRAIQAAVREKAERARRRRLAEEAGKLNPREERALAEEGLAAAPSTSSTQ
jgi:Arc/MetJ-type ribon-helix-helix transcriptional regulator